MRLKQLVSEWIHSHAGKYQKDLAKELGVSASALSQYINGNRQMTPDTVIQISNFFGVSADYLLGLSEYRQNPNIRISNEIGFSGASDDVIAKILSIDGVEPYTRPTRQVPRLGTIACGVPILAEENFEGMDDLPDGVHADFTLVCKGDSMVGAHIRNGDIVFIRYQQTVENGEIAAVKIGEDATLKRVRFYDDHIAFWPENPNYEPILVPKENADEVQIIGKAVYFLSEVR